MVENQDLRTALIAIDKILRSALSSPENDYSEKVPHLKGINELIEALPGLSVLLEEESMTPSVYP